MVQKKSKHKSTILEKEPKKNTQKTSEGVRESPTMTKSKRRKKKHDETDEVEVPIFDEEDIDPLDLYDLSDPKEA